MSRLTGFAFAACLALAGAAVPASAMPITWTLQNVTFGDGAMASGSFVYDADTNTFGSIAVTTTSGPLVTGATYTLADPGFPSMSNFFVFVTGVLADYTGTPALALQLLHPMTDAGGTIPVSDGEFACVNAGCTNGTPTRHIVSVASITATAVPEPATIALLFAGLLGAGVARRKKAK